MVLTSLLRLVAIFEGSLTIDILSQIWFNIKRFPYSCYFSKELYYLVPILTYQVQLGQLAQW